MSNLQTNLTLTQPQAETVLSAWLGHPTTCSKIQRLHGGMINSVLRLDFNQPPFTAVIKLSTPGNCFVAEAKALNYLRACTRFPAPQAYLVDDSAQIIPYAFLLIETMPGVCMAELELSQVEYDHIDRQLASALLELHSHTHASFGAIDEQSGHAKWSEVFLPRLHTVRREPEIAQRLSQPVLDNIDHAIRLAEQALDDPAAIPTLVHNDIWSGNLMVTPAEDGWQLTGIIDPGIHYADVEAELAYLEVFNTRRAAFFEVYTAQRPMRPGYAYRRLFYWLHTALIHVWLFGDPFYCDFTAQTAEAICQSK